MSNKQTIAILGGSGDLGGGLAYRWAQAGYPIVIGSRTTEKGEQAATDLTAKLEAKGISNHPLLAQIIRQLPRRVILLR